jgi:dolichyl-phosphate-mannose-protein mannosyltransferase
MTGVTTGTVPAQPATAPGGLLVHAGREPRHRARRGPRPGGWAWWGPLLVTGLAGVLRFDRLGEPKAFVIDETYYAKDAYALLRFGYERSFVEGADAKVLAGETDVFTGDPSYAVHPPAGKWVIALGEQVFGLNPFGWRAAVALVGTLTVLILARTARRMTGSTLLGCLAGLLLAVDGLSVVMSRTALLDGILAWWLIAAFGCLVVDRDRARERLGSTVGSPAGVGRWGPRLGLRPWRLAGGICLGLACATKWSGLYALAAFGLLTVLWDVGARRSVGVRAPLRAALVRDAGPAFLSLVGVAVVVYLASWTGWFLGEGGWDRAWAAGRDTAWPVVPAALRSLWHYHAEAWRFHVGLETPHPYQANPWSWLVQGRPMLFVNNETPRGQGGCPADTCTAWASGLGTPLLWWAGTLALAYVLWRWGAGRDWRAGAVLAGVAGTYLPWFAFQDRTTYSFYAVTVAPFVVLALTLALGAVLGPPGATPRRRMMGAAVAGAVVVAVVVNAAYFYPIVTALPIDKADWIRRMWLKSWI